MSVPDYPVISIATPSFNQASYICETIESVLSQEGAFEIEYFIVDGGSTDGSVEIIQEYAERLKRGKYEIRCAGVRLEWTSARDSGQADAINRALRKASGSFASYINSDDLYSPGAFASVIRTFAENPAADFVYGDGDVIDEGGGLQWEWLSRPYDHRVMTSYHFLWNDFTNYIMQQATFWRTSVHKKIGLFDETFHFALDVEYWIRAGHAGLNLVHIPEKLGKFRMIQGTKSLSSPVAFWSDYLEIFRRYRRDGSLHKFFAFYYFDLMRYKECNLAVAREAAEHVFRRWAVLPDDEQRKLREQSGRGYSIACFLIANELQKRGEFRQAQAAIRMARAGGSKAGLHPAVLYWRLKQLLGSAGSRLLDRAADRLIAIYRRNRFDYRYQLKRSV